MKGEGNGVLGTGCQGQHPAGDAEESRLNGEAILRDSTQAIRCDHDGLKMAEVKKGHLILRTRHHGETHVKIVALDELAQPEGRLSGHSLVPHP